MVEEEEGLGEKRRGEREAEEEVAPITTVREASTQVALSVSPPLLFSSLICLLLVGPTLLP